MMPKTHNCASLGWVVGRSTNATSIFYDGANDKSHKNHVPKTALMRCVSNSRMDTCSFSTLGNKVHFRAKKQRFLRGSC